MVLSLGTRLRRSTPRSCVASEDGRVNLCRSRIHPRPLLDLQDSIVLESVSHRTISKMTTNGQPVPEQGKKQVFLNGFDMFCPGHLSFGQWVRDGDRAKDKRRDLSYWTDLALILERGGFTSLFLADTYGQYDVYQGGADATIRGGAQFPMGDPSIVSNAAPNCPLCN